MKPLKVQFVDGLPPDYFMGMFAKRYDVVISDKPDFLFYNCHSYAHLDYRDCVKIFVTNECVVPNFNECDYAVGYDYMTFGERYLRFPYYYWHSPLAAPRPAVTPEMARRRFCNFIYCNVSGGEGSRLRQEFCRKLMGYQHVDCPGRVLNNMPDAIEPRGGDWIRGKLDFLQNYKFTIAFENARSDGYTTEKLTHAFAGNTVPIYWGNPRVAEDFNPKAFINCNDYGNDLDAVVRRVAEVNDNDDLYLDMLAQDPLRPDFAYRTDERLERFFFDIFERGNHPLPKSPTGFGGDRDISVSRHFIYSLLSRLTTGKAREAYRRRLHKQKRNIKF